MLRVRNFQRRMLQSALEHLDDPIDQREFDSLTIALSKRQFNELKSRIKDWIRDLNQELSADADADHNEVYQLNAQLFRLSR